MVRVQAKKDEGFAVSDAEELVTQAFAFLEQRDYDRVRAIIAQAEILLGNAKMLDIPTDVKDQIAGLLERIKGLESKGLDVGELYGLLNQIYALWKRGILRKSITCLFLSSRKSPNWKKIQSAGPGG